MVYSSSAEQPVNLKATAWTIGVHAALLLLFFFVKYSLPQAPPVKEMGIEVNLGTDADGSGDDQPMAMDDPAPDNASAQYTTQPTEAPTETRDMMESDEPDAPEVPRPVVTRTPTRPTTQTTSPTTTRRTNTTQPTTTNPQPRRQQPRYVYGGATGRGGNGATENRPGTSEGNTTGPGDRGGTGGTPSATNYTGAPGRGTGGISNHTLADRSIVAFPPPEAEFRDGGTVVIRVTVDRNGTIIDRRVRSGSNELRIIALRKLDKVKFNKNPNAPIEQFGDITFVFKTRS